jgi:hypothetical protein
VLGAAASSSAGTNNYRARLVDGVEQVVFAPGAPGAPSPSAPAAPSLATYLRDSGAKLSFHVFVSQELADFVKAKLNDDRCSVDHLEGCRPAFDHVTDVMRNIPVLPGSDDTLESVTGPGATWGVYDVSYQDYSAFPPE